MVVNVKKVNQCIEFKASTLHGVNLVKNGKIYVCFEESS